MARKRRTATATQPEAIPVWHAHIGRNRKGLLCFLGLQAQGGAQNGSGLEEVAVVDVGRPFQIHVPSSPGRGTYGMVIDGMTSQNAVPWSASQVLAAARHRMFGFQILDDPGSHHGRPEPRASPPGGQ